MRLVWTQKRMARRLACWTLSKLSAALLACCSFFMQEGNIQARQRWIVIDDHCGRQEHYHLRLFCVYEYFYIFLYTYIYMYICIYIHVIIHVSFTICKMMQHSELQNKIWMNACHWVQHCSCFGGMPWILQGTRYPLCPSKRCCGKWGLGSGSARTSAGPSQRISTQLMVRYFKRTRHSARSKLDANAGKRIPDRPQPCGPLWRAFSVESQAQI